jgi:putative addiction module killer protein
MPLETPLKYPAEISLDKAWTMVYTNNMRIRRTSEFKKWLCRLRDSQAVARILARIKRLAAGNPGDVKPIGEGCSEMRIDYGPGYRVYYKDTGTEIIILLCGGDKTTQQADIASAKEIAQKPLEEEKKEENEDG